MIPFRPNKLIFLIPLTPALSPKGRGSPFSPLGMSSTAAQEDEGKIELGLLNGLVLDDFYGFVFPKNPLIQKRLREFNLKAVDVTTEFGRHKQTRTADPHHVKVVL